MFEKTLHISFLSDWHVGSGLGNGAIADAVLNRDVNGIPYIPGSAIKGALREGAWRLALCNEALFKPLVSLFFGKASIDRTPNAPGLVTLNSARLPDELINWLLEQNPADREISVTDMTIIRRQTALEDGVAKAHSLRAIECGIPGLELTAAFYADLPEETHDWFTSYLAAVCANVKSIGGDRSRGLGRCRMVFEGMPAKISLPAAPPASLQKGAAQ